MAALPRWFVLPFGLTLLSGCLDRTNAPGALGRLEYSISTDFEVPEGDLRDARIVTGHPQRLHVDLTARGARDIEDPALLRHRIAPGAGPAVVRTLPLGSGAPPDVELTVLDPGTYRLQSLVGAEVMDEIDLTFERPDRFELLLDVRGPWEVDFGAVQGSVLTVKEGSQVVVQAIPVDGRGSRLAGELTAEVSVAPAWAVTPGVNVYEVTEWGIWSGRGELDFYFIEPGDVTLTVRDPVNEASTTRRFVVTPVVP